MRGARVSECFFLWIQTSNKKKWVFFAGGGGGGCHEVSGGSSK